MNRRMLCTLFAVLSLFAASAFADSQARIVRLSYVEGDVQIDRGDGHGFNRAFLNMPVIEGARLWTRNDGRVEVEFEDGSTARLTPETIMEFQRLRMQNDGRSTSINIQEGQVFFDISKKHQDDVTITVGQQYVTLQKSSHFRLGVSKEELEIAVFKGDVELLKHNGERVQVRKNETLTLNFVDPDRYYLAKGIPERAHDYWDREREQEIKTYASNHRFNGYSSAYAYGVNDLDQYGSFVTINNYGSVWRPYGVGYGWSPFQDGSWVSYPGQGYVWVSPYRWGWTPYRYGSWVNVSGYGWCWRSGNNWSNWAAVPVVVGPPTSFVAPIPPRNPGIGIVHVGRGGDMSDLGRIRGRRDGDTGAFVPGHPVTGTVNSTTTNGNSVVTTVPVAPVDRVRGGRDIGNSGNAMQDRDADIGSRGVRVSRAPQVNSAPPVGSTPSQPSSTPSPAVSVTPAVTPTPSRPERVSREDRSSNDSRVRNDHPVSNSVVFDRPSRTSPPPSAPASAPASAPHVNTYTPPPSPPPSAAPAAGSGAREGRSSRTPK